jgi:hydroxymethylglutaryl-CoA lyase
MSLFSSLPKKVRIVEVGPRDGLQNEPAQISTKGKIDFVNGLLDAGLRDIEVGAFVSPKWVPKMADSAEVFSAITREQSTPTDARLFALVPNAKGLQDALSVGARYAAVFTAASETFNKKNTNAGIDESFVRFRDVSSLASKEKIQLRGYVSTCFFCPYEGRISPEKVVDVVRRLFEEVGVFEVSLGDTLGAATPTDVSRLLDMLLPKFSVDTLALHMHDTRGTALVNVLAGLSYGISVYDSSAGGLGGCPYAPSATGNVATEDLLYMLSGMNIETGIDLDKLFVASKTLSSALKKVLPSHVLSAGRPRL